jgi:hypothetical protein
MLDNLGSYPTYFSLTYRLLRIGHNLNRKVTIKDRQAGQEAAAYIMKLERALEDISRLPLADAHLGLEIATQVLGDSDGQTVEL